MNEPGEDAAPTSARTTRTGTTWRGRVPAPVREAVAVCVADLRQRGRTPKLLVVGVLVAYFAKLLVVDATLRIGGTFTGVGTSAWYGGMIASIGTFVLFALGFSLVKGSLERDRVRGVGELLATSPMSSSGYLLGKFLANLGVLLAVTATLAVAATTAFFLDGTGSFDPFALLLPFLVVTVPPMVLVAAAGVLADAVGLLRGTFGSVVYFFGAMTLFAASMSVATLGDASPLFDVIGYEVLHDGMVADVRAQYPGYDGDLRGFGYTFAGAEARTFRWRGIELTPRVVAGRLPFLGLAGVLLIIAWLSFDRFDPDAGWSLPSVPSPSIFRSDGSDDGSDGRAEPATDVGDLSLPPVDWSGFAPVQTLVGECRLAFRGRRWWWYLAAVTGVVALALTPLSMARGVVFPLVVLLGLPVWSHLGARERIHRTRELVFAVERPAAHLLTTCLAGVLLAVALTIPLPVRYAMAGATGPLLGWIGAVSLFPAAGTALGAWIGRPRIYEAVFLATWYLGPVNGATPLDVLAVHDATVDAGYPAAFLALAVVCGVLAAARRWSRYRP